MKKNKNTNIVIVAAIYAIVFAVLNILIFVIFKPGNIENKVAKTNFWVTYAFLVISFVLQVGSLFLYNKKTGIDSVFMGVPVFVISAIFLGVEAVVALIFFTLSAFNVQVPTAVVVIFQLLILAAYLVIALLAILAKNHISGINETIKHNVTTIRNLEADVRIAAEACNDASLKASLNKFADDIRFSDPMTNQYVEAIDMQLQNTVMEIKLASYESNNEMIEPLLKKGTLLLKERNMKLVNSK